MIKNYYNLKTVLNLQKTIALFFVFFIFSQAANAQCATPVAGCPNTDLSNFGAASNNNAATIEYDNFVSSWHTTIVRTSDGSFQTWGEKISNTGANLLSPVTINKTNFPALSTGAVPLKAGLGSSSSDNVQGILLATDGLYAWSYRGVVLDASLTTNTTFQKVTISGNSKGLPSGVEPGDVKMMFVTYKTLAITTCSGDVWVISQTAAVRGNGAGGNATTWYKVKTSEAGNPFLTDVVACRGNNDGLMALKADGSVYVWGTGVFLGNNTAASDQNYASQMTIPTGITPKMIGSTGNNGSTRSHYILATDGNLYALGKNGSRQLGDWTNSERLSWVQPRYTSTSGPVMDNIKWISTQEHDGQYAAVNVLTNTNKIYAFGNSSGSLLGIGSGTANNPTSPGGLTGSDNILAVETGGHTSMLVKSCETKFGYVGHRISGSMGDGTNDTTNETNYTFSTANVQICGAESNPVIQPISTGGGPDSKYCVDDPVLLNPTPAGGVLSILSGPGTLSGNTLSFTGEGTVSVQYSVTTSCGGTSVTTRNFDAALCPADLEITKVADNASPSVGGNVVFTITAKNKGPYKATGVSVSDALPSGYTFVSAVPSVGTWSAPNWSVGSLANGASVSLAVTASVNATGSYANTASISGNNPDSTPGNNSATATPSVQTNLSVTKSVSNTTPNVGDQVTFTITASNAGPSAATGVKVTDNLPSGYTFVSATASTGTWSAPDWTIGNLANGASATLTMTATVNASGSYANTASVSGSQNDPTPGNNSGSVTPTVNHHPTAVLDTYSVPKNNTVTLTPLINDTDVDGNTLTITSINGTTLTGGVQSIIVPNGTVTISALGVITFTPAANFSSTTPISFPYEISDGHGGTASANIEITVTEVNDNPVAVKDVYTVAEDNTVTLTPLTNDTDVDGDTLTIISINGTALTGLAQVITVPNGTVTISALGVITFTPSADFNSTTPISFPYEISDGHGGTASANIEITVTPVNDNPVAVKDVYTVAEDNTVTLTPLINDTDVDGDTLTITSINGTALTGLAQVITVPNGTVNISASGVITFTPSADFNSTTPISFPYEISDGHGGTASANIEITVTPVNDAPIANNDTNNIISSAAGATTINALTATDIDGTIANYTILSLPADGILSLMGNPVTVNQILTPAEAAMLTYTPSGTFTGNVTFTFTATDDLGLTAVTPATVTIPVGNNAPVAHDDTNSNIPSRAGATAIKALTATDTDGTIANYIVLTLPAHGVLALSGVPVTVNQVLTPAQAAMLTYDPSSAFSGNDSFTFTATDNNGAVDVTPATITIPVDKTVITAAPDPVGSVVGINEVVELVNVLKNDTLNNDPLLITDVNLNVLVKDPNNVLTLKPDGTAELAPNAPAGNYTLTYEICEKANPSNCTSAVVSVTVEAPKMTIKASSYCADNTPYVSYNVTADNFTPKGLLTINWIDSANNIVATQTNLPLNGNLLWPGAVVDSNNKPIDWPGWVLVNGQWVEGNDGFELTRPAVTIQFTLNPTESVTVNYPAASSGCNARPLFGIKAENDDNNIIANGTNGSTKIVNVLENDKLNGTPVNPADVVLTPNNFPSGITLNSDGTIDVAPGTTGGSHTLTYQICEKANPNNCSSASVQIFVETPSISLVMKASLNDENGNGNVEAGETVTYTFTIKNTGNVPLSNILIADLLPGVVITGGPISLGVGESDAATFTGTYILTQDDINKGSLTNQAAVSGVSQSGTAATDKSDAENISEDNPTVLELNGCNLKIYNAVSLNGDGLNERFYIKGIECYPDNTVQIFNRWGVLVFNRDHYNNNDVVFKGFSDARATVKESNGLPEGTYYYIVRYSNNNTKPKQEAGYLYLTK